MKSLVEYIQEQLKETSKYAAEFTVKNNTIKVDDLINALSHSHGSLPTKDLSIDVEDDYEDEEEITNKLLSRPLVIKRRKLLGM